MTIQNFNQVFNLLTSRRKEVLLKFLANQTDQAIAESLNIEKSTVRKHLEEVCKAFGLENDFSDERRSKRQDLIALFVKYKPDLLNEDTSQVPQFLEPTERKKVSNNADFVGRESAIADSTPENVDYLVQRVRSRCYDKIQRQCGKMQLLNISQRVDLDNLYIDVNILKDIPSQRYRDVSQLAREFDPSANDFNRFYLGKEFEKRVSGLELVKDQCKVMVLGKPGSGKTTFLQYVAVECSKYKLQPERVLIFIRLFRFAEDARDQGSLTLLDYIEQEFYNCGIDYPQAAKTLLKCGRCLILLDGLDEVPAEDSKDVVKRIRQFCDKYYNNSFIITCRINAQEYTFKDLGFIEVEVANFNEVQINKFAEKWFVAVAGNDQETGVATAKQFIQKLRLLENRRICDLAVTPILLHLTCLFFRDREGNFPAIRSELYEEGLNILLSEWDDYRDIKRDEVYGNLSPEDKKNLLSHVAATLFAESNYFPKQEKLQQIIAAYCNLPNAQSKAVMKSIEKQHGLLIERAQGVYSFSHLTFQEYFTARQIIENPNQPNLNSLEHLVKNHINQPRWREIFLLVAEMLLEERDVEYLLLLMKREIDKLVASDRKLRMYLRWVTDKSQEAKTPGELVKFRASYFESGLDGFGSGHTGLATQVGTDYPGEIWSSPDSVSVVLDSCLKSALKSVRGYLLNDTLHKDLDCVLKCALDPHLKQKLQKLQEQLPDPHEDRWKIHYPWWIVNGKVWTQELRSLMLQYRNIGHDWQFSDQQKQILTQYHDANWLLVNCLNSGCNVSPKVRSHIENTLLLPIDEIEKRRLTVGSGIGS